MSLNSLRLITTATLILAFAVLLLGAYTRLTDAGLGCPDWPGCYGHILLPTVKPALNGAQTYYPTTLLEPKKAWTEMIHRYAAGTLAILIVFIALGSTTTVWSATSNNCSRPLFRPAGTFSPRRGEGDIEENKLFRSHRNKIDCMIPSLLILLVIFQALLGMWTVTLKLLPIIVMSHLLGGMLIFSGLCCFRVQLNNSTQSPLPISRWFVGIGLTLLLIQISLGGWISANYAGMSCVGFPKCNGLWIPPLHFSKGFNLFSPVGANYQGGVLMLSDRITIHWIHRLGAFIVAAYTLILGLFLLKSETQILRKLALCLMIFVSAQFSLGVVNVTLLLPLWAAVLHNGVAALLLATLGMIVYIGGTNAKTTR